MEVNDIERRCRIVTTQETTYRNGEAEESREFYTVNGLPFDSFEDAENFSESLRRGLTEASTVETDENKAPSLWPSVEWPSIRAMPRERIDFTSQNDTAILSRALFSQRLRGRMRDRLSRQASESMRQSQRALDNAVFRGPISIEDGVLTMHSMPDPSEQCTNCKHFENFVANGSRLHCGMHPYGPEEDSCQDREEKESVVRGNSDRTTDGNSWRDRGVSSADMLGSLEETYGEFGIHYAPAMRFSQDAVIGASQIPRRFIFQEESERVSSTIAEIRERKRSARWASDPLGISRCMRNSLASGIDNLVKVLDGSRRRLKFWAAIIRQDS